MKVYHEIYGTGFPLILLHGNGEDHSYFQHQIAFFSKYYQVIAIDSRGHGQSKHGDQKLSLHLFVEDLYELIQDLHLQKVHLLGFSDGANVAMLFTIKYPTTVEKLILNAGNLFPMGMKRWVYTSIRLQSFLCKLFPTSQSKRQLELNDLMLQEPNIEIEQLHQITSLTLVIVGSRDMIKHNHSLLIHQQIKNSEFKVIQGNHFIAKMKYNEFNQIVFDFLKKG